MSQPPTKRMQFTSADKLDGFYMLSKTGRSAVLVIQFASRFGGDAWYFQAKHIARALWTYNKVGPLTDDFLFEALSNIRSGLVSSDASPFHPRVVVPGRVGTDRLLHQRMYTFITLPDHTSPSKHEKCHPINKIASRVLRDIRLIMLSSEFDSFLFKALSKDRYQKLLVKKRPPSHLSFQDYLQGTSIEVQPATWLGNHFVVPVVGYIKNELKQREWRRYDWLQRQFSTRAISTC